MSASRRSTPIGGEDAINNLDKQSILLLRRYQVAAKRALRTTIPTITDRIVVRIPGHWPTYQDLSEIGTQKAPPPFTFPESGLFTQVDCPSGADQLLVSGLAHQKFSICQTFLGPPASAIANMRPFGDGIACQTSGLLDLSRTAALPSSETLNKALSRSKLCQDTRSRFPSADQFTPIRPFHPFTTRSRVWPVEVERSWILSWLEP